SLQTPPSLQQKSHDDRRVPFPTPERTAELHEALRDIRAQVHTATPPGATHTPTLPLSDILACYEAGQRDFGENYVQELHDKAQKVAELAESQGSQQDPIRWHFIGALQSNKAGILAKIPNLHCVQTVSSTKIATYLNKNLPPERTTPLNMLLQVNTSGEDNKAGIFWSSTSELTALALHVIQECPNLHLQGLMTIGSLSESLSDGDENKDFKTLIGVRDTLEAALKEAAGAGAGGWGEDGRLLLSMGMSSDFKAALAAGSDVVRVGTGIFGARPKKEAVASAPAS
ncbi:hypothetical protein EIP91_006927, partial [Steccherinum ochraceum]